MTNHERARDLAIDIGRAISLRRDHQVFYARLSGDEIGEWLSTPVIFTGVSDEAAQWLRELLNSPITRDEWLRSC